MWPNQRKLRTQLLIEAMLRESASRFCTISVFEILLMILSCAVSALTLTTIYHIGSAKDSAVGGGRSAAKWPGQPGPECRVGLVEGGGLVVIRPPFLPSLFRPSNTYPPTPRLLDIEALARWMYRIQARANECGPWVR